ncbi:hypothetical protein KFE25_007511 [Diacronema lutheri]|uniref:ADP-ribosylation factor-like protein 2-binding protein n=1 Tax=Diacronema lutheri TaxID=2081491 RepID=A0A7R9YP78_DIALT|nr:hypothetical protein KFE25_007511 [Diacronema lutheri]|mmetsp:Transcript_9380/g.29603  ORF Transcript_9380/g.29603 Transcript_9380/m.29603 type:complete len:390 (+) Transcript_9380:26-1195(+)
MDSAIAAAERDAAAAALASSKAHEQLVVWTEGEKTVISQLQKIGKVIDSPEFAAVSSAFVQQHNDAFEFCDENKFEHTALHEQFVELMEKTILELAPQADMDTLVSNLPAFMEKRANAGDQEGTGHVIDFLLSLTDFDTFKQTMLASKHETSGSLELADAASSADTALGAISGQLQMNPAVAERANVLLQLGSQGDGSVAWKRLGEKAGAYTLDTTQIGADRFMRCNMVMQLPLEHALGAHCNWADPEFLRYDDVMCSKVEVLRNTHDGPVHDYVARMHLKLPGVMKFVPNIPKTLTMRSCVERDAPKPGSAIAIWTTWDVERDCADVGPNSFVRIAVLEDAGGGVTNFINVSRMPPVFPTWVASLFMSKTIVTNIQSTTIKYKKLKGL